MALGKVYFNGATVQMETNENNPSVRANEIIIKEDDSVYQSVSYKDSDSDALTTVAKDNRIAALKASDKKIVVVSSCQHEDAVYTDNGDNHTAACPYCGLTSTAAHGYGEPA